MERCPKLRRLIIPKHLVHILERNDLNEIHKTHPEWLCSGW